MKGKILIVEDERIVAEDMRQCLEANGYDVCGIAKSGELAIQLAEEHQPDLIMMDIVIRGDIDGIETAKAIKAKQDVAVIFLTAYSQGGIVERAKETNPLAYICKPFEEATLLSTLEIALHKSVLDDQLKDSHDLFFTTLKSIGDGVISTDIDGNVVFLNEIAENLTGWTLDEARGHHLKEVFVIVNENTRAEVEIPSLKAMETNLVVGLANSTVLLAKGGEEVPIDDAGSPIHSADGQITGSVLVFRDVTEHKKRQRELESYRDQLEVLVEERTGELRKRVELEDVVTTSGVELIQADGARLQSAIKASLERFGECLGLSWCAVFSNGDPVSWEGPGMEKPVSNSLSEIFENWRIQDTWCADKVDPSTGASTGALDAIACDQVKSDLEAKGVTAALVIPDRTTATGDGLFVLCSGDDREWAREDIRIVRMMAEIIYSVLERQCAEQERIQLAEELKQSQKMEAIGKLSGGIAHDFNNMLVPIIGYSDMMLGGESESKDEVVAIRKAAESAAALTRQLLAFSRKQILRKDELSVSVLVEDLQGMLSRIIGEDIKFHTVYPDETWNVLADRGQIEQVVLNLCVNARDAMPYGGDLSLSVENVTLTEDSQDRPAGDFVRISVKDSGCGMTTETMEHVFEPFFTTKGQQGTGLGLSVVLGIIEQHGGWMSVESELDEGTEMIIHLPSCGKAQEETGAIEETVAPVWKRGNARILLVEDEPSVMDFVKQVLSKNGYDVVPAGNVQEAMTVFEAEQGTFDLVFTDAMLPDGTGVDVLDFVTQTHPDIKRLLSSGYSDDRALLDLAARRSIPFLQKPYSLTLLYETVEEVLNTQVESV